MAVKIRLKKMGSKKRPFFRIVVADSRSPRDGRFIDKLGHYDPMTDPAEIKVDEDRLYRWLDDGALPTPNTANVLKKLGLLERWRLLRSGVKISELDARIEERRAKQPLPKEKSKVKMSKKAMAAARAAEKEKDQEAEEKSTETAAGSGTPEQTADDSKPSAAGKETAPAREETTAGTGGEDAKKDQDPGSGGAGE
ncbi:MAG: 30S ribosomal protein S16 [Candidatus Krumholzibacteriota bacterium]|nr:30S ribosomal protein S16 [Candidatus Krumholzibacteriota bacterium]